MKLFVIAVLCGSFFAMQACSQQKNKKADAPQLKNFTDSVSYSIGVQIGSNLKQQNIDINQEALVAAIKTAYAKGKTALTEEQVGAVLNKFQAQMMEKQQAESRKKGEENIKKGQDFLAQNGKKPGIKTTASGLQYEVIKEGDGKQPTAENTVTVHYTGTLTNGKKFDSSVDRGEPATFPLKGVIKGWTEGLQLMKIGAKYRFYIPAELGYGSNGAGADIGPNEVLIFDVELLEIK